MRKAKAVLKEVRTTDKEGLVWGATLKGDDSVNFAMALGLAVHLAKDVGIPLTELTKIVKSVYKETEDAE